MVIGRKVTKQTKLGDIMFKEILKSQYDFTSTLTEKELEDRLTDLFYTQF